MQDFEKRIVDVYNNENTGEILKERMAFWVDMMQMKNGENESLPELMFTKDIDKSELKEKLALAFAHGKTVYRLGYMDGTRDSKAPEAKIATLSLEDLTLLIKIYDSVKKLESFMIGTFGMQRRESKLNGISQKVVDVICNNICSNMADRDEFVNEVIFILCMKKKGAEKRAKILLERL